MKFLCIIFGCPNGARKWHITDCYASIAIPIDILNMGGPEGCANVEGI